MIVAMSLYRNQTDKDLRLMSVCSRGTVAEWGAESHELLAVHAGLDLGQSKIKLCTISKHYIATFSSSASEFRVFDVSTKSLIGKFAKPVHNFGVSTLSLSRRADTLAFTQGKILYLKNIADLKKGVTGDLVQIRRDCKLVATAVTDDGLSVATGDESGKIYYITNPQGSSTLIIQTLHWHASSVTCLQFIRGTPLLMSGGSEAVLVQWHLEKQER